MDATDVHSYKYKLFTGGKFSDIDIKITLDGKMQVLHLHRLILAEKSEYFDTLLSSDFAETKNSVIDLTKSDFDGQVIYTVLAAIYNVTIQGANLFSCILCADYFRISELVERFTRCLYPYKGYAFTEMYIFAVSAKYNSLRKVISRYAYMNLNNTYKTIIIELSDYIDHFFNDFNSFPIVDKFMLLYHLRHKLPDYSSRITWLNFDDINAKDLQKLLALKDVKDPILIDLIKSALAKNSYPCVWQSGKIPIQDEEFDEEVK